MASGADADRPCIPRSVRRSVTLENHDGTPLAGATVLVSAFGSNYNHCGVATGIRIGEFTTDRLGRMEFDAPPVPLAVNFPYSEQVAGGPAGTAFASRRDIITGSEKDVILRRWCSLPEFDYEIAVRHRTGRPAAGYVFTACLFDIPCGAGCGSLTRTTDAKTDKAGRLRFRSRDLREIGSISITSPAGRELALTPGEMRTLLTARRVTMIVD